MKTLSPPTPVAASRILIVDDEPHVRKFLRLSLQAEGFDVVESATAEDAITVVHQGAADLMILDLGLPDLDGRQVIRDVRLQGDLPILVLSGRTEDSEKIAALEQGADDYMTKPFAMRELVLRVRAALQQQEFEQESLEHEHVHTGVLRIGLSLPQVTVDRATVDLEKDEYALLRILALHGGRVMTFGRITRALWGSDNDDDACRQQLQKHICGLRRKLEREPSFPRYIVTEPAVGYRLEILPPAGGF